MAYGCSKCNIEFGNYKELIHHMIDVHNSPFVAGDEKFIQYSKKYCVKKNKTELLKLFDDYEDLNEVQ